MDHYDVAQICLNGHMINSCSKSYPTGNENFCSLCGSKTITACPHCSASIRGDYYVDNVAVIDPEPMSAPAYCYNCGKPFPWTESAIKNAEMLIRESELDEAEVENMISSIPDLIVQTPGTNLAISRAKRMLKKVGETTIEAFKQFIVDVGCELAKRKLGL